MPEASARESHVIEYFFLSFRGLNLQIPKELSKVICAIKSNPDHEGQISRITNKDYNMIYGNQQEPR